MFASCFWLFFLEFNWTLYRILLYRQNQCLTIYQKAKSTREVGKNKRHPTVMAKKALPLSGLVSAAASASIVALGIIYGGYLADCRVQPERPSHFASDLGDVWTKSYIFHPGNGTIWEWITPKRGQLPSLPNHLTFPSNGLTKEKQISHWCENIHSNVIIG